MKWWWDSLCYPPVTIRSSERCWQEALGESPCPCDQPRALDIPVVSCTYGLVSWQETTITNRSQKYNMDEHVCFALCLPSRRWQLSVALLFYHTLSTAKQVSNYWNKQPVAKEIHVYIYIQSSWSFRTNQQQQQPNTKRRATEGGHEMLEHMIKHDSINIWIKEETNTICVAVVATCVCILI